MDASSRLLKTCEETRELIAESLRSRLSLKRQVEESDQTHETIQSSLKRTRSNTVAESHHSVSRDISAAATATIVPDIVLDQEAFYKRLESFSDTFIIHNRPVTAVQCAMHGFIDTHILEGPNQDICKLVCEMCQSTNYVIDLTKFNSTIHQLKLIVDKYTSGLQLFHKNDCVWRKHQCPTKIYSFSRVSHREAVEKVRKESKELLQYGANLPQIEHPLNPQQLNKLDYFIRDAENPAGRYEFLCTPLPPLSDNVRTSYTLPLFGWQLLDNGTLKCTCCFRQCRSNQFDGSDHVLFNVVKEHRDYCPWINPSSAQVAPPRPSPFMKSVCGYEWMVATIELEYEMLLRLRDESPVYQSSRAQWFKDEQQRVKRTRKILDQEFPDTSRMVSGVDPSAFDLAPIIPQESPQTETHASGLSEQHREEHPAGGSLSVSSTKEDEKKAEVSTAVPDDAKHDMEDRTATDNAQEVSQLSDVVTKDAPVAAPDQGTGTEDQDRRDELTDNNKQPSATNVGEVSKAKAEATIAEANTPQAISSPLLNEADILPKTPSMVASPLPKHLEDDLGDLLDSEAEAGDAERKESPSPEVAEETTEATEDDLGEEFDDSILDEVDKMDDISTPAGEQHEEHNKGLDLEVAAVDGDQPEAMEVDEEPHKPMTPDKTPATTLNDLDKEMEELPQSPAIGGDEDKEELGVEDTVVESTRDDLEASTEALSNIADLDNPDTQAPALTDEQLLETEETDIEAFAQSPAPGTDLKDEESQTLPLDDSQFQKDEGGELGEDTQPPSIVIEAETPLNNVGTPNAEENLDNVDQAVAVEVKEVKEVEVQEATLDTIEDLEKDEDEDRVEVSASSATMDADEGADEEMALVDQDDTEMEEQHETIQIVEVSTDDIDAEKASDAEALIADSVEPIYDVDSPMADATEPKEGDTTMDEEQPELVLEERADETVLSTPTPEVQEDEAINDISEKDQELKDDPSITNTASGKDLEDVNQEEKQDTTEKLEGDQSAVSATDVEEDIDQEALNLDQEKKTQSPSGGGDDVDEQGREGTDDASRDNEEHLDEDERLFPSADAEQENDEMSEARESLAGQEGEELGEVTQNLTHTEGIEEEELDDQLDDSKAGEEHTLEDAADTLLADDDEPTEESSTEHENLKTGNQDTQNTLGDGYETHGEESATEAAMAKDLQEDV